MKKYAIKMGILYVCISIVYLFICNGVANSNTVDSKIIDHELRLMKDGQGDYMIISIPHELYTSEEFNARDRVGATSIIFICRRDSKWEPYPPIRSPYPRNHPLIEGAVSRLQLFMDVCDRAIPNEEVLSMGYYADYNELIIYLAPELLKNKTHHEEVVKKLNNAMFGEIVE